jgi:hypothetical protein
MSGERLCTFTVGDETWATVQSAWMCWRESDGKIAKDIDQAEAYDGVAQIADYGIARESTSDAWVRYWFAHSHETMTGLDSAELIKQISRVPKLIEDLDIKKKCSA